VERRKDLLAVERIGMGMDTRTQVQEWAQQAAPNLGSLLKVAMKTMEVDPKDSKILKQAQVSVTAIEKARIF